MNLPSPLPALLLTSLLGASACATDGGPGPGDFVKGEDGKADSSVEAIFLDFELDGELVTRSAFDPAQQIEDQLLYTIGQLNGDRSVGRLDKLELSNIATEDRGDGSTLIRYHARLPVAWGKRNAVPTQYTFELPRDMSFDAIARFADDYGHDCVDASAHDVESGNFWYYYRPAAFRCQLASDDIVLATADVTVSDINTTGKFPEYHKVWEDDALQVVAVFGKYEDGATSSFDAGISAYNRFHRAIRGELASLGVVTTPESVPSSPGVDVPEISYTASLPDGKTVVVHALLVDNVRTAGAAFDARYGELSSRADLIVYNGHAGLGANIRALAGKGRWVEGQYAIVFMNGCDTYAYVDSALTDAHAAVNPDDPAGTKYVDIVTNAMPSFFHSMSGATMALIRGLMQHDAPVTYEQMFRNIDAAEVVLVSGEQDNEFVPGGGGEPVDWDGLAESGDLTRGQEDRFETPTLAAGRYLFETSGSGDADLYVRVGEAPTTERFDCRPYKTGSTEACEIELPAPAPVHVMVRGYSASSAYQLSGARL